MENGQMALQSVLRKYIISVNTCYRPNLMTNIFYCKLTKYAMCHPWDTVKVLMFSVTGLSEKMAFKDF